MSINIPKPPEILDKIVDVVLKHRPKTKRETAVLKRKKRGTKKQNNSSSITTSQ
jgi:hypothetical protein